MKRTTNLFFGALAIATGLAVGCGGDSGGNADHQDGGATSSNGGSDTGGNGSTAGGTSSGGASSTRTSTAGDSIPLDAYLSQWREALCRKMLTCLGSRTTDDAIAGCVAFNAAMADAVFEPTRLAAVEGKVVYDGSAAAEFIKGFDALACEQYDSLAGLDQESVFRGTIATGETCSIDRECIGAAHCVGNGTCPGTCTPLGGVGAICASQYDCQTGLACSSAKTCTARVAWGGSCVATDTCVSFTACSDDAMGAMACLPLDGVKTYTRGVGETCNSEANDLCEDGLACEVAADGSWPGVCVARAATGAACRDASPDMCPSGQYCRIAAAATAGTCTDDPKEGEACGPLGESYAYCSGTLSCVENKCVALKANGQVCSNDDVCASSYCKGGTCAAKLDCELTGT